MATRIIAVLNQKGGVGKTTTCVNLGAALARRGFRVLLVDMDPQANLTVHLGLEPPRLERTTYSLLIGQHGLAEAVHETGVPGLLVVPSTLALANAEIQLASTVGRELVLREALEAYLDPSSSDDGVAPDGLVGDGLAGDGLVGERAAHAPRPAADFVIIDCPPSLGTLTMNALCAAGEVLLPIQTEFFALQGVAGILESVRAVQRLNKGLRLSMVVPSLVDRRTTLARDVLEEVRAYFGDAVTRTEIRKNVKLAEAPSHGKTIFEWEPRCNGAADYESLAAEVLGEGPDDEAPDDETPDDEAVDVATVDDANVDDVAGDTNADDVTADDVAADDVTANDVTADDVAADDVTADDVAADDVAADDVTADDVTADDVTADDVTADDVAADDVTGDASEDEGDDVASGDPGQSREETAAIEPATPADDAEQAEPRSSGISIAAPYAEPERVPASTPVPEPAPALEPARETAADAPPVAPERASWWRSLRRSTLG